MRIELTGPSEDPEISIVLSLEEGYELQYGMAPETSSETFTLLERGLFMVLKESRQRAAHLFQEAPHE